MDPRAVYFNELPTCTKLIVSHDDSHRKGHYLGFNKEMKSETSHSAFQRLNTMSPRQYHRFSSGSTY